MWVLRVSGGTSLNIYFFLKIMFISQIIKLASTPLLIPDTHTHTHDFYFLSLINNSHISSKATRKYLYFASNFFSLVLSLKQSNQTFALITLPKLLLSGLLIIFILLNIITDFQLFSAWPVSSTWHTWSLLPPWYTFFT